MAVWDASRLLYADQDGHPACQTSPRGVNKQGTVLLTNFEIGIFAWSIASIIRSMWLAETVGLPGRGPLRGGASTTLYQPLGKGQRGPGGCEVCSTLVVCYTRLYTSLPAFSRHSPGGILRDHMNISIASYILFLAYEETTCWNVSICSQYFSIADADQWFYLWEKSFQEVSLLIFRSVFFFKNCFLGHPHTQLHVIQDVGW